MTDMGGQAQERTWANALLGRVKSLAKTIEWFGENKKIAGTLAVAACVAVIVNSLEWIQDRIVEKDPGEKYWEVKGDYVTRAKTLIPLTFDPDEYEDAETDFEKGRTRKGFRRAVAEAENGRDELSTIQEISYGKRAANTAWWVAAGHFVIVEDAGEAFSAYLEATKDWPELYETWSLVADTANLIGKYLTELDIRAELFIKRFERMPFMLDPSLILGEGARINEDGERVGESITLVKPPIEMPLDENVARIFEEDPVLDYGGFSVRISEYQRIENLVKLVELADLASLAGMPGVQRTYLETAKEIVMEDAIGTDLGKTQTYVTFSMIQRGQIELGLGMAELAFGNEEEARRSLRRGIELYRRVLERQSLGVAGAKEDIRNALVSAGNYLALIDSSAVINVPHASEEEVEYENDQHPYARLRRGQRRNLREIARIALEADIGVSGSELLKSEIRLRESISDLEARFSIDESILPLKRIVFAQRLMLAHVISGQDREEEAKRVFNDVYEEQMALFRKEPEMAVSLMDAAVTQLLLATLASKNEADSLVWSAKQKIKDLKDKRILYPDMYVADLLIKFIEEEGN